MILIKQILLNKKINILNLNLTFYLLVGEYWDYVFEYIF